MELTPDRLRACRTYAGITQGELARRVGISRSFLSAIERDERRMTPAVRDKILDAFQVPREDISQFIEAYEKLNRLKETD